MKKMMKLWTVVAVAAMGLTACQNNFEEAENVKVNNSVVVSFVAEPTKTSVDTSGDTPLFSWDENETFAVLEQTDALAVATSVTYNKVDGKANIDAEFAAKEGADAYNYVAVYPQSGYVAAENINAATLALPAKQAMAEASYDPNADLMVSMVVTTAAQPTEAQQMRFTRLAAVAKMTLKNLTLGEGEVVEKVVFTAEGKTLAGSVTTDLADPATLTAVAGSSSVEVATSSNEVYFTVLPTTLAENEVYGVAVVTNKYLYAKKSAIPAGKSLVFEAGKVSRFSVDMEGVTASDRWVLVRDASTLEDGDVVTLAAKNYDYAVGKQGNSYPVASQTTVVKVGDYLSHPIATESTTADNRIQHYTLMKRFADRTAFDFYNAKDFESDDKVGFLWATGTSYSPIIQAYFGNSSLFDVTIDENGVVTVTANEIEGSYKYWRYYHSTYTASSRKFDLTSSVPTGNNQVCLYKLVGEKRTIPAVAANVTVPSSKITIAEDGVATPTAVDAVVFNYVGDWTISVSDNADWLTVSYADGKVSYTAEANTGAKREATVTITATKEGETDLSWTFGITQKGAPVEISIAEFITKEKDVDSAYKITGKITEMSISSDGTYKITDGTNVATITYLYTDAGEEVYDKDILKVGDVVTLTTVVATSTKGKGGSSSYYSYYKGHYNLSATTTTPIIEYEGGTATIDVALNQYGTLGTIATPTAIEGTMPACDFAEFAYTANADTATVTFGLNEGGSREVTATFKSGLAEATVKVSQKNNPAVKVGWFLVTDASELAVGDKVIIVALNSNKALAVGSSTTSTTTLPSVDITKSGDGASELSTTTEFTLGAGKNEGEFSFNFMKGTTEYYLVAPNSNAQLRIKSMDDGFMYYGSWTISVNATTGEATVDTVYGTSSPTPKRMIFNSTSGKFLTCKTADVSSNATYAPICLYKYYN